MATVLIYDKPMCCSTGVCGPEVDPILPRFAADLDWLASNGHIVQRYNLAQQPAKFAENPTIQEMLSQQSVECLPVILVDGSVVSKAVYPTREQLAQLTSAKKTSELSLDPLPIANDGDCCGPGCC